MPPSEWVPVLVAGGVLGVLAVLGALFALLDRMDNRYWPRGEAKATLDALQKSVDEIKRDLHEHLRGAA